MVNNIELADLGEEPAYSFVVFLSVPDGSGPVSETSHQRCGMIPLAVKLMDDLTRLG